MSQPIFVKTSKGFVNLNHVQQVTFSKSGNSACVLFVNDNESLWLDDPAEAFWFNTIMDKVAIFDTLDKEEK